MIENLYKSPGVLLRHQNAPLLSERERYLEYRAEVGCSQSTLLRLARELLWVARMFQRYLVSNLKITPEEIRKAAGQWARRQCRHGRAKSPKWPRELYIQVATHWFRFLGCLHEPISNPMPFEGLIEEFAIFMKHERGLSSKTIQNRCWHVKTFLIWYQIHGNSFSSIQITDVYRFLTTRGTQWSRVSVATAVKALRAFFKYASMQGWCNSSIAETIEGPRIFSQEALPSGPSWVDVKLLIHSMNTNHPRDIRDRAITMFFAIYGLRSSEVSTLRLEDIHWEDNKIIVSRGKQRRSQIYPLFPTVGNAVIHYLKAVRPQCSHREVFLTLKAPIKPLSLGALYNATRTRFENLKIPTLHRGPHALRHACATHLVSEGLSLKEIGDHLGHQSACATRIYAKVDLPNLREVAAFNFGGVL